MEKNKNNKEVRYLSEFSIEKREEDEGKMIIEGYAAVYDNKTHIGGDDWGFDEIIEKGAFNEADLRDVPLKYNHEDGVPILARTRNKSLELRPDDRGLHIRAELLDTQDGKDMYKRIKSGLIDKMSFAFTVPEGGEEIHMINGTPLRTIKRFDKIFDVSVVDMPAYEDTSVFARSREHVETCLKNAEADQSKEANKIVRSKECLNAKAWAIAYGKGK